MFSLISCIGTSFGSRKVSKRTLQEWEQGRAVPRGFARTAVEKSILNPHSLSLKLDCFKQSSCKRR